MDTIYGLATAPGKSGVAVLRLSGPSAMAAAEKLVGGGLPPHGRSLRNIVDGQGLILDQALILTFLEGRSFTGEAVVELHVHGSRAVLTAVHVELGRNSQLRQAEAGEFTRRAFENARLDLSQVEGLADLLDAETEGQRRQAQRILSGELARRTEDWREKLLRASALVEATIDFADEDVPVDVWPEVWTLVTSVADNLRREAAGVRMAERLREGFEVAIVGAPNVGKSTLLNYLAGRDAAITSAIAGTTRDVIEVRMDLDGCAVTFLDTAGLRVTDDPVEQIGIGRAIDRAIAADLRLHLLEPGAEPWLDVRPDDLVVAAKADVHGSGGRGMALSGRTGEGIAEIVAVISARLQQKVAGIGVAVRERHRAAMLEAVSELELGLAQISQVGVQAELVAQNLRSAVRALDGLVGRVGVEDILGEIFSRFCIGK
jgi:tRNA modification GTPase